MRIGINARFLTAPVTGVQRFAREVVPRIAAAAETVLLLPRGVHPPDDWHDVAASAPGRLAGHAWEQLELPARLREHRCDVCLNLSGTAPVRGGPHVMVLHDVLPLSDPAWFTPRFAAWFRIAAGRAARRAAAVVTVSEWSRRRIIEELGIPAGRVTVAAQGVAPFDRAAEPERVADALASLSIPRPYVLTTGAGDRRKNTTFFAAVARRWREAYDDAPAFVVAGEANRRVHGDAPPREPGLIHVGRVADDVLHALYAGAAAFAFPSLAEGFGRPPLEALACGASVVAADYGPAREVLGDDAAIVPLDADAWVSALRAACMHNAALRRERALRIAVLWRWEPAVEAVLHACRAAAGADLVAAG